MKRKAFARALAVALCLMLCVPALATSWVQPGQTASDVAAPALYAGDEAVLAGASGGIGAYVDGQGGLYLTGYDGTMSLQYAAQIIHVDEEEVLYLAGEEMEDLGGTLMRLNLSDLSETALADNVLRACAVTGDTVYYVSALAPMALMRLEIDAGATTQATATQVATAEANIVALHMLPEGLVAELEAGQGALLYNHRAGAFAEYTGELPASALYVDGAFLRLSAEGMLSMQALDTGNVEFIDFGVQDFAVLDGNIYYISTAAGQKRLKAFDPAQMSWRMLASLDLGVTQAAASAENLFLLNGSTGEAYRVDVGTGALAAFNSCDVAALAEDGYTLDSLRMEAMSGQVNLYAIFAPEDLEAEGWGESSVPTFNFGDDASEETGEEAQDITSLVAVWVVDGEDTAADVLKPQEEYGTLSRGSRGDAVRALQQRLIGLGYLDDDADGIFGPNTQYAVRLLQTDLASRGFAVNGVASAELQDVLFNEDLPAYDPYKALSRGNTGLRVTIMQERLRALGYLADGADGIYGARTQEAVALFQEENGLSGSGTATRDTLQKLYASNARYCASYIYMEKGDTGDRVRELNQRLKALYYYEGTPGSSYNNATVAAVKRLQAELGLRQTGTATASLQERLFSAGVPEYSGYITLQRGDSNDRVAALQRRLRDLNYYDASITGNFGSITKAAVELFQYTAGLDVTGVATVETQQLLFSNRAPVYVAPTPTPVPTATPTPAPGEVGVPQIGISPVDSISGGVYYLDPAAGRVNFTWSADGNVAAYYVRVADSTGNTIVSQQVTNTNGNLSLSAMDEGVLYTISVGAIPVNGTVDNARWAHLQFALKGTPTPTPTIAPTPTPTPAPGEVGIPTVSIEPVESVSVDMVNYVKAGTLTLGWSADGDVDHYLLQIFDGMGQELLSQEFTATTTTLGTRNMREGEVYTLRVTAVPVNGTVADGKSADVRFALEPVQPTEAPTEAPTQAPTEAPTQAPTEAPTQAPTEAPTQAPTEAPTQAPTEAPTQAPTEAPTQAPTEAPTQAPTEAPVGTVGEPAISIEPSTEQDGIYYINSDFTISWSAEGDVAGYYLRVTNGQQVFLDQPVTETSLDFPLTNLADNVTYDVTITAIPTNGTVEDGQSTTLYFAKAAPQVGTVSAPAISISPSGEQDGVYYVDSDFTISWSAEGDVAGYHLYFTDGTTDYANGQVDYTEMSYSPEQLVDGVTYEVTVTAIPTNGTVADGQSTTLYFMKAAPQVGTVGVPAISIEPSTEQDGVYYVDSDFTISWGAEGDVAGYYLRVTNGQQAFLDQPVTETSLDFPLTNLADNVTYDVTITAIPTNGTVEDGQSTTLYFAKAAPQVGTVSAPAISISPSGEQDGVYYVDSDFTISWSAEGDVAGYHLYFTDGTTDYANGQVDYTEMSYSPEQLVDGVTYEVTVTAIPTNGTVADGQSTTLYFMKAAPQVGTVGVPQVSVSPVSYVDGDVQYLNSDATVGWYADGDVAGYHLAISDGSQNLVDRDTTDTSYPISLGNLAEGSIYQITVTAIPINGTAADGQGASIRVAREPEPVVEEPPVEEPPVEEQPPVEEEPPVEQQPPVEQHPWDKPINRDSDPELIGQMQDILRDWGWLTLEGEGSAVRGQLDDITLNTVLEFQTYVNGLYAQQGTPLVLVDLLAEKPEIGTDTLKLIFNTDMVTIPKPTPEA